MVKKSPKQWPPRAKAAKELVLPLRERLPAPAADTPAHQLPDMAQRFGVSVGLSDHTLDNTTAIAAVASRCVRDEKHFTLDRNGGDSDDSFFLEPQDLAELCRSSHTAWQALGQK